MAPGAHKLVDLPDDFDEHKADKVVDLPEDFDENAQSLSFDKKVPVAPPTAPSTESTEAPKGKSDFLQNTVLPIASSFLDTTTRGAGPSILSAIDKSKLAEYLGKKFGQASGYGFASGESKPTDYRKAVDESVEANPGKAVFGSLMGEALTQPLMAAATGGASLTPASQAALSATQRANQEISRGKTGYDVLIPAAGDALVSVAVPAVGDELFRTLPIEYQAGIKKLGHDLNPGEWKEKLANFLSKFSDERAVKSVASGNNLEKLVGPLKNVPKEQYEKRVAEAADYMRQPREELGGEPILKKFLKSDDVAERFGTVEKGVGEKYNKLRGELASHESATDKYPATQLADELDQEVERAFPHGANKGRRDVLHAEIENIRNDPEQELGLLGIEGNKTGLQGRADYSRVQPPDPEALKWLASKLKERGEVQADTIVSDYAPELSGQFQTLKKDFSQAAAGSDAGSAEAGRALKNRSFTPSDYVAPLVTKGSNDTALDKILNIASMGGHKLARERGSSTMAVGAKNLSDFLKSTDVNKPVVQEVLKSTFGEKYLPSLIRAITSGAGLEDEILRLANEHPDFAEALDKL